jgi:hypothetical protein
MNDEFTFAFWLELAILGAFDAAFRALREWLNGCEFAWGAVRGST